MAILPGKGVSERQEGEMPIDVLFFAVPKTNRRATTSIRHSNGTGRPRDARAARVPRCSDVSSVDCGLRYGAVAENRIGRPTDEYVLSSGAKEDGRCVYSGMMLPFNSPPNSTIPRIPTRLRSLRAKHEGNGLIDLHQKKGSRLISL